MTISDWCDALGRIGAQAKEMSPSVATPESRIL